MLGLDLQGGSQLLLEVDQNELIASQAKALRDDVRRVLQQENVRADGGIGLLQRGVQVKVADDAARAKVLPKLQELSLPITTSLGQTAARTLDIAEQPGGVIRLTLTDAGITDRTRRAVSQGIEVIRRRLDSTGTTEPSIQQQGADRILIQVPGEQNPERLEQLLGSTAKLEFRMLADSPSGDVDMLPSKDEKGAKVPVERRVMADGGELTDAQPAFDQQSHEPMVSFKFNLRGAQRFGQATSENVGRRMAIVLDNEVVSAPVIRSAITGGSGQITGNFTVQQANDLSVLLRAGALPAKFTVVERRVVGPGLGRDSIEAGKLATLVAAGLVVGLHVRDLRHVRLHRQHRPDGPCRADPRPDVGAGGDHDASGHRRHRADHRHGGGFQRADLRAHARGEPCRPLADLGAAGGLRPGLRHHHRLELDHGDRRPDPVLPRLGPGEGLRRGVHPRHPDHGHHRGDADPDDDRGVV